MLDEVKRWFTEIAQLAEQLLNDQKELLNSRQTDMLFLIHKIASYHQPQRYPFLEELLQEKTPFEAVAQMSTEWRTPLTTICGYCEMLLLGFDGPLSIEQRDIVEQIKARGEALWNWCSIGSPYLPDNE
ncbi:MAG: hypothetical protein HY866_01315 [Chloroflexi bacterium]|nr:hypothetical protein [Chloroflexota bacterium]